MSFTCCSRNQLYCCWHFFLIVINFFCFFSTYLYVRSNICLVLMRENAIVLPWLIKSVWLYVVFSVSSLDGAETLCLFYHVCDRAKTLCFLYNGCSFTLCGFITIENHKFIPSRSECSINNGGYVYHVCIFLYRFRTNILSSLLCRSFYRKLRNLIYSYCLYSKDLLSLTRSTVVCTKVIPNY